MTGVRRDGDIARALLEAKVENDHFSSRKERITSWTSFRFHSPVQPRETGERERVLRAIESGRLAVVEEYDESCLSEGSEERDKAFMTDMEVSKWAIGLINGSGEEDINPIRVLNSMSPSPASMSETGAKGGRIETGRSENTIGDIGDTASHIVSVTECGVSGIPPSLGDVAGVNKSERTSPSSLYISSSYPSMELDPDSSVWGLEAPTNVPVESMTSFGLGSGGAGDGGWAEKTMGDKSTPSRERESNLSSTQHSSSSYPYSSSPAPSAEV